ncbi:sodium/sugar symporter [Pelagerythrobacter aerophilus]|uniref:Sodium transporter n=1 Tax=Pelagerythrobacter aerophilus TaxID=2306995 RepID=A0A418NGP7_9SPHN|nr:sodium/sugar symporter [Pelagerythrobacter aerophilus]RIV77237.1 sodium transporter [Pelagerythrobacter aerophilus]
MDLAAIDAIVVVIYAIGIFGLAQWVSREKGGHTKNSSDYFLASKDLPWWAIGASLIAANISAEQIVGMSGAGYRLGLAIASYEWMAALTLLIVGKYFLPIFLKNEIYTMPQFLEQRYGPTIRTLMAIFWIALYIFVNLTSIVWLGSIAVNKVAGVDQDVALYALGGFALLYQLYGGLKAVALTDIVQVTLLVLGGLIISGLTLNEVGGGQGVWAGFTALLDQAPEKFNMILEPGELGYQELPGIAVLVGGMWIANLSYWGFNQYIIQRALAARSLGEAQKGVVFAAFLKLLMPAVVVLPGLAAVILAPGLDPADEAYPTMMHYLPPGLLGLVFAALMAAVVASTASKINSIATIFTLDLYAKYRRVATRAEDEERVAGDPDATTHEPYPPAEDESLLAANEKHLVLVGRIAAAAATVLALLTARPLLGGSDQAFQFIQEFSGFFTPGITVIFLLGLFWKRASEAGAIAAAIASVALSYAFKEFMPDFPFMNRMGLVFVIALALAVVLSLVMPSAAGRDRITTTGISYRTTAGFNAAAFGVIAILVALYATWW